MYPIPAPKIGSEARFAAKQQDGPGPGEYAPQKIEAVKKQSPNYRFGQSSRSSSRDAKIPGPGAYDHKQLTGYEGFSQSMGIKTTSDETFRKHVRASPGPGQYQPNINISSRSPPRAKFGTQQRYKSREERSPGPGAYNPTDSFVKKSTETWSLGLDKQRPTETNAKVPGPGAYDPTIDPMVTAAPTYRIGTAPRFDHFNLNRKGMRGKPGPANYSPTRS